MTHRRRARPARGRRPTSPPSPTAAPTSIVALAGRRRAPTRRAPPSPPIAATPGSATAPSSPTASPPTAGSTRPSASSTGARGCLDRTAGPDRRRSSPPPARAARCPTREMLATRFTFDGARGRRRVVGLPARRLRHVAVGASSQHADRHGLSLDPLAPARSSSRVDYLVSSWHRPCFDWWEEHAERRARLDPRLHRGGPRAARRRSGVLDADARRARRPCRSTRSTRSSAARGVVDGHLAKWLGSADGRREPRRRSSHPLGVFPASEPVGARRPSRRSTRSSTSTAACTATSRDTFYGGGQWPLLSCMLGLAFAALGRRRARLEQLRLGRVDASRPTSDLPEQVDRHLLDAVACGRSGSTAGAPSRRRCCGRHAMFIRLAVELGRSSKEGPDDPPPSLRLRPPVLRRHRAALARSIPSPASRSRSACARSGPSTTRRRSSSSRGRRGAERVPLARRDHARRAARPSTAATSRRRRRASRAPHGGWQVTVDRRSRRTPRTATASRRRRPMAPRSAPAGSTSGSPPGGRPTARGRSTGASRVVPGSVTVLDDGQRIHRVRFALPLAAGEHVDGLRRALRRPRPPRRAASTRSCSSSTRARAPSARRTCPCRSRTSWAAPAGASTCAPRAACGSTSARPSPTGIVDRGGDARPRRGAVDVAALRRHARPRCSTRSSQEVGRPEELPDWVFRLWASGNEWNTQAEVDAAGGRCTATHDIPVGSVVIEAWSDESTFTRLARRRSTRSRERRRARTRYADFTFPADGAWPDPKGMVDELHAARHPRCTSGRSRCIKMRPHPDGPGRGRRRTPPMREGVLVREERPDGTLRPYRNRGWWFPLGAHARPDRRARGRAGGRRSAATSWRRSASTASRPTAASTPGVATCATSTARTATRATAGSPCTTRRRTATCCGRAGKAPVTFSRAGFTGQPGARRVLGRRRELHVGGVPLVACSPGSRPPRAASSTGAGTSPASRATCRTPSCTCARRRPRPSCRSCSTTRSSTTTARRSRDRTPWNIAERTGDDRVHPGVPALRRGCASGSCRTSRPCGRDVRSTTARRSCGRCTSTTRADPACGAHPLQWMLGDDLLVAPVSDRGRAEWRRLPARGRLGRRLDGRAGRGRRLVRARCRSTRCRCTARGRVAGARGGVRVVV